MYIQRLALRGDKFGGSVPHEPSGDSGFMFGTCDQADADVADAILALNEAILGIREDDQPIAARRRCHPEASARHNSSTFMFGVHPEQPKSTPPVELPLCLWASDLD